MVAFQMKHPVLYWVLLLQVFNSGWPKCHLFDVLKYALSVSLEITTLEIPLIGNNNTCTDLEFFFQTDTLEKLKSRAERFGSVISPLLSKVRIYFSLINNFVLCTQS